MVRSRFFPLIIHEHFNGIGRLPVPGWAGAATPAGRLILMSAAFCLFAAPTLSQPPEAPRPIPSFRYTAKGEVVVPMIFPVLGSCRWSDTWGASQYHHLPDTRKRNYNAK